MIRKQSKRTIRQSLRYGLYGLVATVGLAGVDTAAAATTEQFGSAGSQILQGARKTGLDNGSSTSLNSAIENIINLILWGVGLIAVVVIIIAGVMFMTAAGDPSKAKKAKDTILYAVVGLVIAILAYAIVNFVVSGL